MSVGRGLLRSLVPLFAVLAVLVVAAVVAPGWIDSSGGPAPDSAVTRSVTTPGPSSAVPTAQATTDAARRDLSADEARGGHTIARHVGRSDADLRERLRREPDIAAASTFTDLATAEWAVGTAIAAQRDRIATWSARGADRSNLVLEVRLPVTVGRSLRRGHTQAQDASTVIVVLRAAGTSWYVLTSYPEDG